MKPTFQNDGQIFPKVLPSIRSISAQIKSDNDKLRPKISSEKFSPPSNSVERFQSSSSSRRLKPLLRDNAISGKFAPNGRGGVKKASHGSRGVDLLKKKPKQHESDHNNKMSDKFTVPYRRSSPSPPPPYSNQVIPGSMNRVQPSGIHVISDEVGVNKQSMYPPEVHKLFHNTSKAKKGWKTVKKTSNRVIPIIVRRTSTGCCTTYVSTINFIRNKKSLMLLLHCSLFLLLAGYIIVGASILMKIDGGQRYASRGQQELERLKMIREKMSEKLLSTSLKSILENSRDAVLDTIFTSDALQAALTVFKTSRRAFLPADHELELLSEEVLTGWEKKMDQLLVKYHFISSLETSGYQLTKDQLQEVWDTPPGYSDAHSMTLEWTFWEALVQCFCLMSTIDFSSRSPSSGGKVGAILYAMFGIPLYWWIILIWSKRLLNIFILVTKTSNQPNVRKVSMTEDSRIPTPHWNESSSDRPADNDNFMLLIFVTTILTIAYVIGIGPLGCGSPSNDFGERLEAAFLALLTVRPPTPLPKGGESSIGFILYIFIGHMVICTFLRSIKISVTSTVNKIFHPNRR